jgi:hypothetical protein
MTDTTYTEYGYRRADGEIRWPDSDGDLYLGSLYRLARTGDGVLVDVEELRRHLPEGATLVSREQRTTEPVDVPLPLPAVPGSVIRASVLGRRRTLALMDAQPNRAGYRQWFAAGSSPDGGDYGWVATADLTDVEILFVPEA